MSVDIQKLRRETPGCERVIHLNNAGAALQPNCVVEAVAGHLRRETEIGGYEAEAEAQPAIEGAYGAIAKLLHCAPEEIALVENATRGWDMVFYSLASALAPGDRILTSQAEYASNYIAYLQAAKRTGASVEAVPNDDYGALSIPALESMIDGRVKLISITHIPTNGGLINPAAEVGRVAKHANIPYLLDACQSVGQLPVDVASIGCDFLSATGRKYLRGPRGTGFLYVRKPWIEKLEPPFLDLHAATWNAPASYDIRKDARRFENWESYVAGRIGLGAAAHYALDIGIEDIADRIHALARAARSGLERIPGVVVRDLGHLDRRCGIVSFTCEGRDARGVQTDLRSRGINVSSSRASSTYLDMTQRQLGAVVRASFHCYNTEDEVEQFCAAVADVSRRNRAA